MSIKEKYPEDIPWDLKIGQSNCKSIQWMLTKADIVYTFTRSRINDKYVYIQKNDEKKTRYINIKLDLPIKDYLTRDIHWPQFPD